MKRNKNRIQLEQGERRREKKINRRYKKCVLYVWILFIHGDILHGFVVGTVAAFAFVWFDRSFMCVFFCHLNCPKINLFIYFAV